MAIGLAALTVLCALVIGASAASARDTSYPPRLPEEQEVHLLYSQSAPAGSLESDKGGHHQTLTLRGVSQTVWFEDRPGRQSGQIPTAGFVDAWSGFGFSADPPNAVLTVLKRGAGRHTTVVELRNPRFRPGADLVRYRAEVRGEVNGRRPHVPRHFGDASLVIDDASSPTIGTCVLQPYANCSGANLVGAGLEDAYLGYVNYSWANLTNANLTATSLVNANARGANFTGADLGGSHLNNTDFSQANFSNANLGGADMSGADLDSAVFCATTMPDYSTEWSNCPG